MNIIVVTNLFCSVAGSSSALKQIVATGDTQFLLYILSRASKELSFQNVPRKFHCSNFIFRIALIKTRACVTKTSLHFQNWCLLSISIKPHCCACRQIHRMFIFRFNRKFFRPRACCPRESMFLLLFR